ncbi:hypothetical protein HN958_04685 [Candidatus Falkowbacteria bacterium]|jgi:hypothetical protein|nr:hypothetical protein [Candidatus Falkowbacteria bacterium]MBT7007768.1 hypothetical protein [Candidatus Falkowbacteria bacterium]
MHYTNKLIIATIAVIFIISGLLFLIFHHKDTLITFAPGEATAYLHTTSKSFNKLPESKKNLFLKYLEQKSSLNKTKWNESLSNVNDEFALFSVKKQAFGMIKQTENNVSLLNSQNIPFSQTDEVLFFPKINVSNEKLTDQDWFKKTNTTINFSKYTLLAQNSSLLNVNFPEIQDNEPILAKMDLVNENLRIKLYGKLGQSKLKFKRQVQELPEDTKLYISGLTFSKLSQKSDYTSENFPYILTQSLAIPFEYVETDDTFQLYLDKKDVSLENFGEKIKEILAFTYPTEENKLLPDNSIAKQLIANKDNWQFESHSINGYKINDPELYIYDLNEHLLVTNAIQGSNFANNTIKLDQIAKNCNIKRSNQTIYTKIATQDTTNNILISNINKNRISICID